MEETFAEEISESPKKSKQIVTKKPVVEETKVPTGHTNAFKLPDGEVVGIDGLLVFIANQLIELRRSI